MTNKEQTISNLKKLKSFHNGSYGADIDSAIKALEHEPCEDAISRQAVEKITWEDPSYTDSLNVLAEVRDKVRALPLVNPQPKPGHWIEHEGWNDDAYSTEYSCSECNEWIDEKSNFCPNCGAKMIDPQESEDKE